MGVLDHVEAHVLETARYGEFLVGLFEGGNCEVLDQNGTLMFSAPEGGRIEIKRRSTDHEPIASGFCNPCLRRQQPLELLRMLSIEPDSIVDGGDHQIVFFTDHEGVTWHIKDLP